MPRRKWPEFRPVFAFPRARAHGRAGMSSAPAMYNRGMTEPFLTQAQRAASERLADDLSRVFGDRLRLVVAYDQPADAAPGSVVHTLALVESVRVPDLAALLTVVPAWHKAQLAIPLVLSVEEFSRTLDVFPLEYQSILSRHAIVRGEWPGGMPEVRGDDLRRACERQMKGHLVHLRGAFLETHGRPALMTQMIKASIPAFRAALQNLARLHDASPGRDAELSDFAGTRLGADAAAVRDVLAFGAAGSADPASLLPRYLDVVEQLWRAVDRG